MAPVNKVTEESSFDEDFALEILEDEYDPAVPEYSAAITTKPPAVIYEPSYESAPEPKKRRLTASEGGKAAPNLSKDENKRQKEYAEETVNIARARKINGNVRARARAAKRTRRAAYLSRRAIHFLRRMVSFVTPEGRWAGPLADKKLLDSIKECSEFCRKERHELDQILINYEKAETAPLTRAEREIATLGLKPAAPGPSL